jgi:hypothetical protein
MTDWRFDENNPYEDSFEDELIKIIDSSHVMNMIRRKLLEVQRNPKANPSDMVRGKLVYIAKTGPIKTQDFEVEPLLIVYTLSESRRLIQRVFVCKAASVGKDPERGLMMGQLGRTLRQAIGRAIANAGGGSNN